MNAERRALHAPSRRAWLATMLLALVVACGGGGVDTGGTGAAAVSYSLGRIEGFGSIVVNGVHYDDAVAAIVDDDGNMRARADLQLGMTVQIDAGPITRDAAGQAGSVASKVQFGSEIRGPVESVDAAHGTLRVLGQVVRADVNTVISGSVGLAPLRAGDLVQVFAFFDASSGTYTATRIERQAVLAAYKLRGPIARLDASPGTFTIGTATISYAGIAAADLPGLQDGVIARVDLRTQQQAGRWVATRIVTGLPGIAEQTATEIEGFVTDFKGIADFQVDGGVKVDASGPGVVFDEGDSAALLAAGARIEVQGRMSAGVLLAERIDVLRAAPGSSGSVDPPEKPKQFELKGAIESVNVAAKSFVVRGTTIVFDATTVFDKGVAADLRAGTTVEAKGRLTAGGTQVHADRVKFDK